MKIGDNIRAARKARGLTQAQVAERLGVTVKAVCQQERKARAWSSTVEKYANAIGCPLSELTGKIERKGYRETVCNDENARLREAPANSDFMQGIIRTAETVPETECLAQLAEEACELSQAALKLRRAMGTGNPTPISIEDAVANLEEEIADVQLCTAVLVYADGRINADNIERVMNEKTARWLERLKEDIPVNHDKG